MREFAAHLIVACLAGMMIGCANYTTPISTAGQMTAGQRNFESLWQASRQVLRKYDFVADREDRREGSIVSRLMTGAHIGEFWRRDAATARDLAEGTVQTIYRQVKVTVQPVAAESEDFQVAVEVRTFRSNRPQVQITNTSDAMDLFRLTGSDSRRRELLEYEPGEAADSIVELGRDDNLERKIAAEIQAAASQLRQQL